MSFSHVSSHRRKYKPRKRSKEEDHDNENIHLLKNKRKSHIAGITKLINSITELIDQKGSFSDFSKKIIGSESDNNVVQLELEICTEQ